MFKMVSLQQYGDGTVRVNPRREGRTKGENKQYRGICFKKLHNFFFSLFPSCASLDLGRESSSLPSSSYPAPPEEELQDFPKAIAVTGGKGAVWPGKRCSSSPGAGLGAGALDSDG